MKNYLVATVMCLCGSLFLNHSEVLAQKRAKTLATTSDSADITQFLKSVTTKSVFVNNTTKDMVFGLSNGMWVVGIYDDKVPTSLDADALVSKGKKLKRDRDFLCFAAIAAPGNTAVAVATPKGASKIAAAILKGKPVKPNKDSAVLFNAPTLPGVLNIDCARTVKLEKTKLIQSTAKLAITKSPTTGNYIVIAMKGDQAVLASFDYNSVTHITPGTLSPFRAGVATGIWGASSFQLMD